LVKTKQKDGAETNSLSVTTQKNHSSEISGIIFLIKERLAEIAQVTGTRDK
jgi:hypothetical protein